MRTNLYILLFTLFTACGVSRSSFSPNKKYSLQQVQKDYSLYREILEEHHPSLYWYTSKDSMDHYFSYGQQHLKDSMTEQEFRKVLNYVTSKIGCGHTSVRSSKAWIKYTDTARLGKMFPLSLKIWKDSMVVTANLNRKDSIIKRGTVITRINGKAEQKIVDTLFDYISTDGYNLTHKYQTLSNRGFFGSLYTSLFGVSEKYTIEYMDAAGQIKNTTIPVYNPSDTINRAAIRPISNTPQPSRKERKQQGLNNVRLLKIDSVNHTAMMDLSSFAEGYQLRRFFRNSFRALQQNKIGHLIIDVRNNGGGEVTNSMLISRYLVNQKFKISDSLYSVRKGSPYQQYIKHHFWNKLFMTFFTKKKKDGNYHFGYFERHYFKPKKNDHYDGKVYILIGGNSFSATTLFVSSVIQQDNVTVVGEETGGGAYGNSAWLIPNVTLPETGVRFRLPLFRLVLDKDYPKTGKGVQPEVESKPTVEAVRRSADYKLDKAMELIKKDKNR
ncbi:MAG TPA: S41 family peptidase [Chitinophagaceae bacterium]|nr:S41 family peptidase [Chitinophagaceae bacterium]